MNLNLDVLSKILTEINNSETCVGRGLTKRAASRSEAGSSEVGEAACAKRASDVIGTALSVIPISYDVEGVLDPVCFGRATEEGIRKGRGIDRSSRREIWLPVGAAIRSMCVRVAPTPQKANHERQNDTNAHRFLQAGCVDTYVRTSKDVSRHACLLAKMCCSMIKLHDYDDTTIGSCVGVYVYTTRVSCIYVQTNDSTSTSEGGRECRYMLERAM